MLLKLAERRLARRRRTSLLLTGPMLKVGASGEKIGMRGFGDSAPIADLLKEFWFTRETVVAAARRQLDFLEKSP